jgi:hypothetical protein
MHNSSSISSVIPNRKKKEEDKQEPIGPKTKKVSRTTALNLRQALGIRDSFDDVPDESRDFQSKLPNRASNTSLTRSISDNDKMYVKMKKVHIVRQEYEFW